MTPIEQLLAEEECQAAQAAAKQAKKQRQKIRKQQQQQSQQQVVQQQQVLKQQEPEEQQMLMQQEAEQQELEKQQQQHVAEQQQQQWQQPTFQEKQTQGPTQEQQSPQEQKQQSACLHVQPHAEQQPLQAHPPTQTQLQLFPGTKATGHAGAGLAAPLPSMSGNVDSTEQTNVASAEQLQSRPGTARELTGTKASPEYQQDVHAAGDDDFLENLLSCPLTRVSAFLICSDDL